MQEWRRLPGVGRYARPELERRFLVADGAALRGPQWLIEDRYIDGTSLRLRRTEAEGESVWKLTQKVRFDSGDPASVSITNLYLTGAEYDLLVGLPAARIVKTRTMCLVDGARFVIDAFSGALIGLFLAEVEVEDLADPLPQPSWLGREVTHDDRFSGGRLARLTAQERQALLTAVE